MLGEVGKRRGETRRRFFMSLERTNLERVGSSVMQDNKVNEAGAPVDLLDQTEALYRDVAEELAQALQGVRRGDISEAKAAVQAVKDLRTAFHLVMEERSRVEKLRRQLAGVAAGRDGALDFDAARAEIGRRLARLRDA
ncbi:MULTISPECIES: hypothetical protein [Thioclava]|uniref:hypothetical protein n=2 Tax=Paracoccaceae TaxID=31989 RepID=UPI001FED79BA|nr:MULTISPECIES: hypothetical protein [Thioclava]